MTRFSLLLSFFLCAPLSAERILLPFIGPQTTESEGTLLATELWAHNLGNETIRLRPTIFCPVPSCILDTIIEPGVATRVYLAGVPAGLPPGRLLDASRTEGLFFNLRASNQSHGGSLVGVELPVIREAQMYSSVLSLLNIPGDPRVRHTLWIYDIANRATPFRIRIYQPTVRSPLFDQIVTLNVNSHDFATAEPESYVPSSIQMDLRPIVPAREGSYYISVEPLQSASFWAFVSLTNSETQELTVITPGGSPRSPTGRVRSARR